MKIALFIGNHSDDNLVVQAGWWITRKVQKGQYSLVTHVEAIHEEHEDGTVTIASASVRDGGVRAKRLKLNPDNWWIVDVLQWDVRKSIELLESTNGKPYDWRGAVATVFIGSPDKDKWFCNKWVAEPYIKASATFGPHQFTAIALSLGQDVTSEFFNSRC